MIETDGTGIAPGDFSVRRHGNMSETLTLQTLLDLESKLPPVVRYPRIISVNARVVDVPVKTHRKKRIAKKWLKRFGTKTVIERYLGNNVLIAEFRPLGT